MDRHDDLLEFRHEIHNPINWCIKLQTRNIPITAYTDKETVLYTVYLLKM